MTKEKIIEIVNSCVQYNANQGTWSIDNRFADALLAEFEQELLKRLEQLHAEMDERMREEVAIEKRMGEKKAEKLLKKFVEWYKAHLNDLVKYEKDLYGDATTNQHEDNATFFEGEINMLKRLLGWIDIKLERFLEENKNDKR